jgi:hypothetical protein
VKPRSVLARDVTPVDRWYAEGSLVFVESGSGRVELVAYLLGRGQAAKPRARTILCAARALVLLGEALAIDRLASSDGRPDERAAVWRELSEALLAEAGRSGAPAAKRRRPSRPPAR